ncbi:predicted protein [Candida tropicalis MYA-3404]|uniref:Uncharacterized protein n=1 Tax=Candida tropicalis (strain ATCC MYA-3404 / T1) TaxID=294747 RepID=C5M658_CANTT|nr:predicted protein [Candida tropicalis MYA-3404]EER34478.1 predicted protein [Candida tropicalis MYA-3404]KAG4408351.1 hypothetical protein JTP64_001657 [Candida tropicalis]
MLTEYPNYVQELYFGFKVVMFISLLGVLMSEIFPELLQVPPKTELLMNQQAFLDYASERLSYFVSTAHEWTLIEAFGFILKIGISTLVFCVAIIVVSCTTVVKFLYDVISLSSQNFGRSITAGILLLSYLMYGAVVSHNHAQRSKQSIFMLTMNSQGRSQRNRILIPEVNNSLFEYLYNKFQTRYFMFLAAFKSNNSHYNFPRIDFTMSAPQILDQIGPELHSSPFNSTLLTTELYKSTMDKSVPIVTLLGRDELHFKSLKHFKVWFLRQHSHGQNTPCESSKRLAHLKRELKRNMSRVHDSPKPESVQELSAQISLFTSLPYLSFYSGSAVFEILRYSTWNSYPWLNHQVLKIVKRNPSIDFNHLMYILVKIPLKVPKSFPLRHTPRQALQSANYFRGEELSD